MCFAVFIGDFGDDTLLYRLTSTNTLTLLSHGNERVVAGFSGLGGNSVSSGGFTTYTIGAGEFVVDDEIDQTQIVL